MKIIRSQAKLEITHRLIGEYEGKKFFKAKPVIVGLEQAETDTILIVSKEVALATSSLSRSDVWAEDENGNLWQM